MKTVRNLTFVFLAVVYTALSTGSAIARDASCDSPMCVSSTPSGGSLECLTLDDGLTDFWFQCDEACTGAGWYWGDGSKAVNCPENIDLVECTCWQNRDR